MMLNASASIQDKLTAKQEAELLQESLKFIRELGQRFTRTQSCIATAQYYFHKVINY